MQRIERAAYHGDMDPSSLAHPAHWTLGWSLVLAGFASGAALGLGFLSPEFLGGYSSPRRRLLRLGHIALVALGMLNVLFALAPVPVSGTTAASVASLGLAIGALSMPLACAFTAWRERLRVLFPVPVVALVAGAVAALGGA